MSHAPISDELLAALIDALEHLDLYLMANWDEHQRRRVRERWNKVNVLLHAEQTARARSLPPTGDTP
ncbi:MAG: hypothetical protein ACK55I_17845 [bacterium]